MKEGSVLGGTLLITGSCIGAGMLGLPIVTGVAGFFPSLVMFLIAWLFMTTTALLLLEALSWFNKPVNLLSIVEYTLGRVGKVVCWILYLFLFYALLVAYMSTSGNHTLMLSKELLSFSLSERAATLFFILLFGWLIYLGTRPVDHLNRALMFGKIVSYLLLIAFGIQFIIPHLLLHFEPQKALVSFPILIISFGFHNMVPSLMHYMGGDKRRVRLCIIIGSLFALGIYVVWEVVALGVLPEKVIGSSYLKDIDGAEALKNYLKSPFIGFSAGGLAFFAILTSFLANSLSLVHFLRDGFKLKKGKRENILMCLLALIPPLVFSILFPKLFFQALNFAGGICAVVIFGVLPALMVWVGRYRKKKVFIYRVPGGRLLLIAVLCASGFIFLNQLLALFGLGLFYPS